MKCLKSVESKNYIVKLIWFTEDNTIKYRVVKEKKDDIVMSNATADYNEANKTFETWLKKIN